MISTTLANVSTTLSTYGVRLPDYPINYTLNFNAIEIKSRLDSTEKRFSSSEYPNRVYDYSHTFIRLEANKANYVYADFAIANLDNHKIVDWLTQQEIRSVTHDSTYSYIRINDAQNFSVGQEIAVITNLVDFEYDDFVALATIDDVIGYTLKFTKSLGFEDYQRIAHLVVAYGNNLEIEQLTNDKAQAKITWDQLPGPRMIDDVIDPKQDYIPYTINTFRSPDLGEAKIFEYNPNWDTTPQVSIIRTDRKFGINEFRFDNPEEVNRKIFTCLYTGDQEYLRNIEYFIYQVNGQRDSFWFIPPTDCLKITAYREEFDDTEYIQGTHYSRVGNVLTFVTDPYFSVGMTVSVGGTRTITAVDGLVITLDSAPGGIRLRLINTILTLHCPYTYSTLHKDSNGDPLHFIGIYDGTNYYIRQITQFDGNDIYIRGNAPTNYVYASPVNQCRFNISEFPFEYLTPNLGNIDLSVIETDSTNDLVLESTTTTDCYNYQWFGVHDFKMRALPEDCTQELEVSCPLRLYDFWLVNLDNFTVGTNENYTSLLEQLQEIEHKVDFLSIEHQVESSDPHHQPTFSTNETVIVDRYVWNKDLKYDTGTQEYQIKLMFLAEETINNDYEDTDTLIDYDRHDGLIGPLIQFAIYSEFKNPEYFDGDEYLGVAWTYETPIKTINGTTVYHPHLLGYANVRTTLEVPCDEGDCLGTEQLFRYNTTDTTYNYVCHGGRRLACDAIEQTVEYAELEEFIIKDSLILTGTGAGTIPCYTHLPNLDITWCNTNPAPCCVVMENRNCCFTPDTKIKVKLRIPWDYLKVLDAVAPETSMSCEWESLGFFEREITFDYSHYAWIDNACGVQFEYSETHNDGTTAYTTVSQIFYNGSNTTPYAGWSYFIHQSHLPGFSIAKGKYDYFQSLKDQGLLTGSCASVGGESLPSPALTIHNGGIIEIDVSDPYGEALGYYGEEGALAYPDRGPNYDTVLVATGSDKPCDALPCDTEETILRGGDNSLWAYITATVINMGETDEPIQLGCYGFQSFYRSCEWYQCDCEEFEIC